MHFHSQTQTRSTGGFLSPNKRTVRTSHHHHHHHHGHHHGNGLSFGTSGVTATSNTRRSPGTGGLFHRRARVPRSTARTTRTTRTKPRRSGGGLFGGNRRAKKTSVMPVATTTRRRPTLSDRINGAFLKLKGSITRNPREKAIGDRQMHGRSRYHFRR
ncbi:hypothetical protein SEUCBS139899_007254 [Sporothrix eucalyptigena]|uniref:Uncharacterized protein n=1 Tax=Sporothrix eucalyptigena TaxID=1812306 RepID=A0ABP0B6S0_9PEZI